MLGKWTGFRPLILVERKEECEGIVSFYFKPQDGGTLVKHEPGQFLPFKIKTEDSRYKDVMRTYSLSMIPNESFYRISVKKIEGGLMSTYLHEQLQVGDVIEAMVPMGMFTLDVNKQKQPITLISGGIGITPLLSMLYAASQTRKDIHMIQAVQHSEMHPFKEDIKNLAKYRELKNTIFYSAPLETDEKGNDYDELGYVNEAWLKEQADLKSSFYLCGPPVFMKALESTLINLGVDQSNIHYELFSK